MQSTMPGSQCARINSMAERGLWELGVGLLQVDRNEQCRELHKGRIDVSNKESAIAGLCLD